MKTIEISELVADILENIKARNDPPVTESDIIIGLLFKVLVPWEENQSWDDHMKQLGKFTHFKPKEP